MARVSKASQKAHAEDLWRQGESLTTRRLGQSSERNHSIESLGTSWIQHIHRSDAWSVEDKAIENTSLYKTSAKEFCLERKL